MKKVVSVLVILTLGCTSIFAAEVKSGSKTELFADVAGQELSRADMEKVKGKGWLGMVIGGALGGVLGLIAGNAYTIFCMNNPTAEQKLVFQLTGLFWGVSVGVALGWYIPLP